jgi:hypothetical protein
MILMEMPEVTERVRDAWPRDFGPKTVWLVSESA